MKALGFSSFGDVGAVLHVEELPTPVFVPDKVMVEVHDVSIIPSDVKNVRGKMKQTTLPHMPGRDLTGTIVAGNEEMIGEQISAAGGDIGFTQDGGHAEYIVIPRMGKFANDSAVTAFESAIRRDRRCASVIFLPMNWPPCLRTNK
jgi:NADPH:quinone reductase-like Zn-dependent oxidoreductase